MTMDKTLGYSIIEIYAIKYPCITRMMIQNPDMQSDLYYQIKNDMKGLADEHKDKTNITTADILVHCVRDMASNDEELKGMELMKNLIKELADIPQDEYQAILNVYNKAKTEEA